MPNLRLYWFQTPSPVSFLAFFHTGRRLIRSCRCWACCCPDCQDFKWPRLLQGLFRSRDQDTLRRVWYRSRVSISLNAATVTALTSARAWLKPSGLECFNVIFSTSGCSGLAMFCLRFVSMFTIILSCPSLTPPTHPPPTSSIPPGTTQLKSRVPSHTYSQQWAEGSSDHSHYNPGADVDITFVQRGPNGVPSQPRV